MNFSNNKKQNSWSFMIVFFALFFSAIVGITLAFFFANEWASNSVKLSGKVDIMAEGPGDVSIEDTDNECKLIINLDNGYNRFIPGMPIKMPVDVKVFRSTTMPLMRANVTTSLLINEPLGEDSEENEIMQNLQDQIFDFIETHGWYLHTDGYFYYIANNTDIKGGDTVLAEVMLLIMLKK